MSKKDCWILSDSLVGHEKQSMSLANKLNIDYKLIKTRHLYEYECCKNYIAYKKFMSPLRNFMGRRK